MDCEKCNRGMYGSDEVFEVTQSFQYGKPESLIVCKSCMEQSKRMQGDRRAGKIIIKKKKTISGFYGAKELEEKIQRMMK